MLCFMGVLVLFQLRRLPEGGKDRSEDQSLNNCLLSEAFVRRTADRQIHTVRRVVATQQLLPPIVGISPCYAKSVYIQHTTRCYRSIKTAKTGGKCEQNCSRDCQLSQASSPAGLVWRGQMMASALVDTVPEIKQATAALNAFVTVICWSMIDLGGSCKRCILQDDKGPGLQQPLAPK